MKKIIEPSALLDIYPSSWKDTLNMSKTTVLQYRNLHHFKSHVKTLTQIENTNCGISYEDALKELLTDTPTMSEGDYQIIKNRVKENLLKRGLISDANYESYHYDVEGEIWDVSKVIAEDPACFLVPSKKYTSFFYELYINISYPYYVTNEDVLQNMAKILATVELLEAQHIYCKITLILPIANCSSNQKSPHLLALIPLFSHRDQKSIATMSAILNDRLLRKFFFAIMEDLYGTDLLASYGNATTLPMSIVPTELDEVTICTDILNRVITPSS